MNKHTVVYSGIQDINPSLSTLYICPTGNDRSNLLPVSDPIHVNSPLQQIILLFRPLTLAKRRLYSFVPSVQTLSSCMAISHKVSNLHIRHVYSITRNTHVDSITDLLPVSHTTSRYCLPQLLVIIT